MTAMSTTEDHEEMTVDTDLRQSPRYHHRRPTSNGEGSPQHLEEQHSVAASPRSPSPLDLRREDPASHRGPRLPFSISSLLESTGGRVGSALGRVAALTTGVREPNDHHSLIGDASDSEGEEVVDGRESEDLRATDGVRGIEDDNERLSHGDHSDEEEDVDAEPRPFQPYTYTHMPFMGGGLLPHLGFMPPMSAANLAAAASMGPQGSLINGPGGVIRVPAHRPPLGGSPGGLAGALPHMGGALPWLVGQTPLERTAAMAHHLSSLTPLSGR